MTFVDTGGWYAVLVPGDPDHARALTWWAGNTDQLVTTDYVFDETLTLLRSRGYSAEAVDWGESVRSGEVATLHYLTRDELDRAWDVFRRFADKEWSFTDCTSKVVMEALGVRTAFAFDHHFRQFGTVAVAP